MVAPPWQQDTAAREQQVSSTASPSGGTLPGSAKLRLPCQTGWGTKLPDTAHPFLSPPAVSWEQSLNQHKALLPPSLWLCSRLHLASIIQCRLAEALWRHAGVDELSMSWEVGREHSRGLAESQRAARTNVVSCLTSSWCCWFGCS